MKKLRCLLVSFQLYKYYHDKKLPLTATVTIKGKRNKKHIALIPDRHVNYGECYLILPGFRVKSFLHGKINGKA